MLVQRLFLYGRTQVLKRKLIAIAAAAGLSTAATPANDRVDELSWLAGHWATEKDGQTTEEYWLKPQGEVMIGLGRTSAPSKTYFWELLRIDTGSDGVMTYWGAPMGGTPTPFRLTRLSTGDAVFENPKHDFPTRIHYRREGKYLVASVSGPDGVNAQTWRYRRVR
jgi:Domain of unknown function (DUF6265)